MVMNGSYCYSCCYCDVLLQFGQVPWTVIMIWFLDVSTGILGVQIRKMRKRSLKEVCKLPGAGFDRKRWRHLINCLYWVKTYTPTASTMLLALPAPADPLLWCPFRLILPYERFIKGEEDKPLPPIKPRKQENNSQENENKTKVSGAKRIKHEISKSKKEKENAPKPQDASEVSCAPPQKSLPRGLPEPCTQSLIPAQDNARLWTPTIWTSQVPPEWAFWGSVSVEWDRPRIGSGRKQKRCRKLSAEASFETGVRASALKAKGLWCEKCALLQPVCLRSGCDFKTLTRGICRVSAELFGKLQRLVCLL